MLHCPSRSYFYWWVFSHKSTFSVDALGFAILSPVPHSFSSLLAVAEVRRRFNISSSSVCSAETLTQFSWPDNSSHFFFLSRTPHFISLRTCPALCPNSLNARTLENPAALTVLLSALVHSIGSLPLYPSPPVLPSIQHHRLLRQHFRLVAPVHWTDPRPLPVRPAPSYAGAPATQSIRIRPVPVHPTNRNLTLTLNFRLSSWRLA